MSTTPEPYTPGPADAELLEQGETWAVVLVRELRHPPEIVWQALTDPAQLREWAPYDADRSLAQPGALVKLTTVGAPGPHVTETTIARADAPKLLEFTWGGGLLRWRLEPTPAGTRLTLQAAIDRRWIAMGAAGWHLCLDVLTRHLGGDSLGRIVGPAAMHYPPWQTLNAAYTAKWRAATQQPQAESRSPKADS